ncbi:cupin domain-containing protein [Acidithiobacillus sulfurivorans]|uniref:Cupin n=1 Tax=Acidithiobacillus sulfurivorans TaxID=1958756 RepID=A0ABS6A041_9PROT|nr:cupin domain-containing protein [Acidithiobacillus sulfurivorans]MBU2760844.1 cupin [Acidithiobacillus sulfurivorans]
MQLNTDWSKTVVIYTPDLPWQGSPAEGVQRRLLERDGEEAARATSVVRYVPGAHFPEHQHPLGEEIFVLTGTFSDETGSYGPGTYLRNPPGSAHAPYSDEGCILFVKLRHFNPRDLQPVRVNMAQARWSSGLVDGLTVLPLADFEGEHTALVRWQPETYFQAHRHYGGEEILVLEGIFADEHGEYPAGTWMRSPHWSAHQPFSKEGCLILVKTGHLPLSADGS